MNDGLHFDRCQFEARGMFPACAETSIAFSDYRTMHTERHHVNAAAWVPPFALNDKQLRTVLLVRACRYIHHKNNRGLENADHAAINRIATAQALKVSKISRRAPEKQHEMVEKHMAAIRKAGGFLQLHAAVAYRAWRLGMDSVEVGESLAMTPCAVRQALWRMRDTAKDLGFDVGRAGHTAGTRRPRKSKIPIDFDWAHAVALYQRGMRVTDIAVRFGYKRRHGQNRVRRALLAAGVYKMKNRLEGQPPSDSQTEKPILNA